MAKNRERRRFARVERRTAIYFQTGGQGQKGTILNFSEVGILLEAPVLVDPGQVVTIPLKLQSKKTYPLRGTVVWKMPSGFGEKKDAGLMGIELEAAPAEYLNAVADMRSYLSRHTPRGIEERYEVYQRVLFKSGDQFLTEYTENLSRGGMYLATTRKLEPGTVIKTQLEIPGFPEPLEIDGKVAYRLNDESARERGRTRGVGIQFINVSEKVKKKLYHYIQRLAVHRSTSDRTLKGPVPTSGSLSDFLVPELLLHFTDQEATGCLQLKRGSVEKSVYFRNGRLIYVMSPLRSESLGQFLMREGVLGLKDMKTWLPLMEEQDIGLARRLLEKEVISRSLLAQNLVKYQEERLTATFPWFDGEFEFEFGTDWPSNVSILPLQTHRVVFEGVLRWYDAQLIGSWMGLSEKSIIRRLAMPSNDVSLPVLAYRILHELWGSQTIGEVAFAIHEPIETLISASYALVLSRWIKLEFRGTEEESVPPVDRPAKKKAVSHARKEEWRGWLEEDFRRLGQLDYYELLGVPKDAEAKEITSAFMKRQARYHEALSEGEKIQDEELESKLTQILSWLKTAHDTLVDPNTRSMYEMDQSSPKSLEDIKQTFEEEQALLVAMSQVSEGQFQKAAETLTPFMKASRVNPGAAGWYSWAIFKTSAEKHAGRAEGILQKAINRDPSDAQLYYFLGAIQSYLKQWSKAELSFLQAVRLQASFSEAHKGLDLARKNLADQNAP